MDRAGDIESRLSLLEETVFGVSRGEGPSHEQSLIRLEVQCRTLQAEVRALDLAVARLNEHLQEIADTLASIEFQVHSLVYEGTGRLQALSSRVHLLEQQGRLAPVVLQHLD